MLKNEICVQRNLGFVLHIFMAIPFAAAGFALAAAAAVVATRKRHN